jgi:sterol desaturase/sphingolipid hydroxylase (fatty acid hydroxylase superfamily)
MIAETLAALRGAIETSLAPEFAWLSFILTRLLDFVQESFVEPGGRYFWLSGVTSLGVLALAFALRPDWRARWGGEGFLRFVVPRGFFSHPSTITDIKVNVVNYVIMPLVNVAWRLTGAWFTVKLLAAMTWAFGPAPHAWEWNFRTLLAFSLLFAVLEDFGYWVWHYLAHFVPFLWAFHSVHHSAEVLTPLVAGRVHPVEAVLLPVFRSAATAIVSAPALYFFMGEPHVLTVFGLGLLSAAFAFAGNQLFHAHVPISWGPWLNRVFISPATHQIHHSVERRHWNKNMGAFLAIWDWMAGTLYLPDSRQSLRYGIAADVRQPHDGLIAAYLRPFVDALPRRVRAALPAGAATAPGTPPAAAAPGHPAPQ